MTETDKDYEYQVINMIIAKYLDEGTSMTEASLNELRNNRDLYVWNLATKVYSQSGYKVELNVVKNIVDCKIETIKSYLILEKEQKAQQAKQIAEQEAVLAAKTEAHNRNRLQYALSKFNDDNNKANIFLRVREIIGEYLYLEEDEVYDETEVFKVELYKGEKGWFSSSTPERISPWNYKSEEAHSYWKMLSTECGDESDATEILMSLEEEFSIEIPKSDAENLSTVRKIVEYIVLKQQ